MLSMFLTAHNLKYLCLLYLIKITDKQLTEYRREAIHNNTVSRHLILLRLAYPRSLDFVYIRIRYAHQSKALARR